MSRSIGSTGRGFALLLTGLVCALVPLRGASAAQEPEQSYDEAAVRAQMEVVLREHARVRHEGSAAPETTGVEQGDNDMRSRTPALANADRKQPQVDMQDLHARALAMYDQRVRFTSAALPGSSGEAEETPVASKPRVAAQPEELPPDKDRTMLRLFSGALIVVGGAIAWFCSRR